MYCTQTTVSRYIRETDSRSHQSRYLWVVDILDDVTHIHAVAASLFFLDSKTSTYNLQFLPLCLLFPFFYRVHDYPPFPTCIHLYPLTPTRYSPTPIFSHTLSPPPTHFHAFLLCQFQPPFFISLLFLILSPFLLSSPFPYFIALSCFIPLSYFIHFSSFYSVFFTFSPYLLFFFPTEYGSISLRIRISVQVPSRYLTPEKS